MHMCICYSLNAASGLDSRWLTSIAQKGIKNIPFQTPFAVMFHPSQHPILKDKPSSEIQECNIIKLKRGMLTDADLSTMLI